MSRFRWLLPAVVMVSWLIIGGVVGPYAGKLADVQTNDRAAFLPYDAESTRVTVAQRAVQDDDSVAAIVVIEYGREVTGAVTGGVITSAGVVLAATFAALAVPLSFLVQIAFIVAVGVLVDTLIVRSLLVPALSYDMGERVWWPGRPFSPAAELRGHSGTAAEASV